MPGCLALVCQYARASPSHPASPPLPPPDPPPNSHPTPPHLPQALTPPPPTHPPTQLPIRSGRRTGRSQSHPPPPAQHGAASLFILHPAPTRPPRRSYSTFEELTADYESGALHPADLKPALAKHLNAILQPVGRGAAARGGMPPTDRCAGRLDGAPRFISCQRAGAGSAAWAMSGTGLFGLGSCVQPFSCLLRPGMPPQVRDHFENNAEAKALLKQVGCTLLHFARDLPPALRQLSEDLDRRCSKFRHAGEQQAHPAGCIECM